MKKKPPPLPPPSPSRQIVKLFQWFYLTNTTLFSFIWYRCEICLSCAAHTRSHIYCISNQTELWLVPSNNTCKNLPVMNSNLDFEFFLFFPIRNFSRSFHDLLGHENAFNNRMKLLVLFSFFEFSLFDTLQTFLKIIQTKNVSWEKITISFGYLLLPCKSSLQSQFSKVHSLHMLNRKF